MKNPFIKVEKKKTKTKKKQKKQMLLRQYPEE